MSRTGEQRTAPGGRRVTRRAVLAGGAGLLGAIAVGPGAAAAQDAPSPAVIPSPERWSDENLAGFMLHVGSSIDPGQARVAEGCEFEDWPPDEILGYDATLINRKQGETPQAETTLFTAGDVDVPAGALYLINTFERCESDYVGVRLEPIGRDVAADVEEDERPNPETATGATATPTAANGPGFGPAATLGGLTGLGALLARKLRDD